MGTTLFSRNLSFWLDEEPERQEPLAGVRPEELNDLDWLDYQSSFDGERFPVETLPSGLPSWLRLARRWEKKFSVSLREAGELAKTFIEKIWGRQPTPEEIKELEASYPGWLQLNQGIKTLVEEIEKVAPPEPLEVADWVLTHGNYERLKVLLAPPEEPEEKEDIQAEGTAWRYLPVVGEEEEDWPCDEVGPEGCPLESLRRAKNRDEMFSAFRRLRTSKLPQACREQLFLIYRNRKNFFLEEVPKFQKAFFEEKIKSGIQGKELYSRLKRAKMPSKLKSELWELWFKLNKKRE